MRANYRKFWALILATVFLMGMIPQTASADAPTGGSCGEPPSGDRVVWSYDSAAEKLTITGTGKIRGYQDKTGGGPLYMAPWYPYRQQIKSVEIGEGVTSIGQNAFYEMTALTEAVLPTTLETISESAFSRCESLTAVSLPESLTEIQQLAFYGCKSLPSIKLPAGLVNIGMGAFNRCEALTEITIPQGVTILRSSVFSLCTALKTVHLPASITSIERGAFTSAPLKDVYYDGTQEDWTTLTQGIYSSELSGAAVHCLREPDPTPTPEPTSTPSPEPTSTPTPEPTSTPTPEPTSTPKPKPTLRPIQTPTPESPYDRYVGTWTAEQNFNYTLNGVPGVGSWELKLYVNNIYSAYNNGVKDTVLCSISFIRSNKSVLHSSDPDNWLLYETASTDPAEIVDGTASFDANPIYSDDCYGTIRFTDEGIVFNMTLYKDLSNEGRTVPRILAQQQLPRDVLLKMDGFQAGPWKPKPTPSGPQPEGRTPFTDVYAGRWYVDAVRYAYTEALFSGTSATTFSPDAPMTRAQIAQVLANRTEGYSKETYGTATCFTDVPLGSWMCAPIRWAYRNDLASGVGNNNFSPNAPLTREQLVVFLYRYAVRTGADTSTSGSLYGKFPDTGSVSSWAQTAMQWAVNHGIISGSGGKINPKGQATRAQVAQMFLSGRDVLASTRLLPQEERPDPDLTPKLKDKIDVDFVLKCLGDFARPLSVTDATTLDTEAWFELCTGWARSSYASNYIQECSGMLSPISKSDILSRGDSQVVFSRHCMDKPIELFGGKPETVLSAVSGVKTQPIERLSVSQKSIVWTMPSSGFTRFNNVKMISLTESNGKAVLEYSFDKQANAGWEVIPHWAGTVILIPAENSLGYKIESLTVNPT